METLHLVLSNLHWYILASSVLVYALVRWVEARARANPAKTWEDDWLPNLHTLSQIGSQGIDLLAEILSSRGDNRLKTGQAKLEELQTLVAKWETLWRTGHKKDAILEAWAWYVDLQGKAARIPIPFGPVKDLPLSTTPSPRADGPNDLDPDPTTHLDDTEAK
jgi:hypothetical protein